MKLRKSLIIGGLTVMFGLAAFAGVSSVSENRPVEKAKADSGATVYMATSSNWNNHRAMTYFNDGSEMKWFITYTFQLNEEFYCQYNAKKGAATYATELKIGNTTIFSKASDSNTNWKCRVAGTYNVYLKDNLDDWGEISTAFSISTPKTSELLTNSASTFRVWTRADFSWWYNDYAATAIRCVVGGNEYYYEMPSVQNIDDSLYYWYADIPLTTSSFQFLRLALDKATVYTWTVEITSPSSTGVYYIKDESGNYYQDRKVDFDYVINPSADLFAKVLEAFTTCSSSSLNGYGAYSELNTKWYAKLTAAEKTSLASKSVSDYSYAEYKNNSSSYTGLSRNTSVTVAAKWEAMGNMADHGTISNSALLVEFAQNNDVGTMTGAIVIASIAASMAIGGFFFLKKKRISIK